MILELAAATLLSLAVASGHTDTTVTVRPGARLELNDFGGSITVTTWDRGAVRVAADHDPSTRLSVESGPAALEVHAMRIVRIPDLSAPERARTQVIAARFPATVDYRLTVPRWMDLRLSGINTEMSLKDVDGQVEAETVRGSIVLAGGRRFIRLSAIDGDVEVTGARGRVEASSVNHDVDLRDVEGEIKASTVNGSIRLAQVRSADVEASTVNGEILYDGALRDDGRYHFATHEGDVVVVVPERTNAAVSVATFNGEFLSSFPVRVQGMRRGKDFDFVLGTGRGELDLESFSGTIRLVRPGEKLPDGSGPGERHELRKIVRIRETR